jgi:hypothetical protein
LPFYTKPLSQLDTADLQELVSDQAVENARLEFSVVMTADRIDAENIKWLNVLPGIA